MSETARPFIIAHRGASDFAPENTLAAFRHALAVNADGIEMDVRLARNGVPVVIHDADLERTASVAARVADLTADELGRIDVGSWFNLARSDRSVAAFQTETIPTLASVLELLKDFHGMVYIELKCDELSAAALAKAVSDVIAECSFLGKIIVKSFSLSAIPVIRQHSPRSVAAALFAPKLMTILRKEKNLVRIAESVGAQELSLHYALATRRLMAMANAKGLPVTIWTTDRPRYVRRAIKYGISAIITNDPAKLLAIRNRLSS